MHIGVIGAGLAGLAVAFRRAQAGDSVVVFESADRAGGQLWTERRREITGEIVVEHGAEGFVASSESVPRLLHDLGAGEQIVDQLLSKSLSYDGQGLVELAQGEAGRRLGFQVATRHFGGGLKSLRNGMGELPSLLVRSMLSLEGRVSVHLRAAVRAIEPDGRGWRIVADGAPPTVVDAVVLAIPARSVAAMLTPVAGEAARALADVSEVSSVTASLVYERAAIDHPLDATGFVISAGAGFGGVRACTFTSSKFAGRAPPELASLRVFFRPAPGELGGTPDDEWVERATDALRRTVGTRGAPRAVWVSRWNAALPVFDQYRLRGIEVLEEALRGRRILLAGSSMCGSGIDAAVSSAEACANACRVIATSGDLATH